MNFSVPHRFILLIYHSIDSRIAVEIAVVLYSVCHGVCEEEAKRFSTREVQLRDRERRCSMETSGFEGGGCEWKDMKSVTTCGKVADVPPPICLM
jgi:hypothetical protein